MLSKVIATDARYIGMIGGRNKVKIISAIRSIWVLRKNSLRGVRPYWA